MTPRPTTPADIAPVHLTPPPGGTRTGSGAGEDAAAEFDTLWERAGDAAAAETEDDRTPDGGGAGGAAVDDGPADEPATTSALADGFAELWALAGEVRTDLASAEGPGGAREAAESEVAEDTGPGARTTAPDAGAATPAESICQPQTPHLPHDPEPEAPSAAEVDTDPEPPHEASPRAGSGAAPSLIKQQHADGSSTVAAEPDGAAEVASSGGEEPRDDGESATGAPAKVAKKPQAMVSSSVTTVTVPSSRRPAADVASSAVEEPRDDGASVPGTPADVAKEAPAQASSAGSTVAVPSPVKPTATPTSTPAPGRAAEVSSPSEDLNKKARAEGGSRAPEVKGVRRRGPADPVRQVMHRHQALIAGAVDVWEIAAGLEAHGVTDVDARRLRHRDVFGLAEELYARVPRAGQAAEPAPREREGAWLSPAAAARYLLPGAVCAVAGRFLPAEAVTALTVLAAYAVLRRGPLHAPGRTAALWACGLLALTSPTAPGLAASLVPAAYCAHWFAARARAQLVPSHGLDDFADAVRPRLAAALAGYAAVLVALLAAAGPVAAPAALGLLLFTTRLLALHGRAAAAAAVLGAACLAEVPYRLATALGLGGPHGTVHALVCGAAAAAAVVQAFRVLPRAAAHRPT